MKRIITLWVILGAVYVTLEVIWRGGNTHPSMLFVGGLCGILVGSVNQIPRFYRMPVIVQSLIGAVIVLAVEFLSGCVINLWWGWNIWDYTGQFGNILGQVCVTYGFLWLFLMPFAIWLEDTCRWLIYLWDRESGRELGQMPIYKPYSVGNVYMDFLTGR